MMGEIEHLLKSSEPISDHKAREVIQYLLDCLSNDGGMVCYFHPGNNLVH